MSKNRSRPPVLAHENFKFDRDELTKLPLGRRFERIFETNLWGAGSRSGIGAELTSTTALRERLPAFLGKHAVTSVLDIPCGDYSWLSTVDLACKYTGADIVPRLVEENQRRYGGSGARPRFLRLDLTADPLPQADVILCRDCLVHLSFRNIFRALGNVRRSGARYLLTTTFLEHEENADIEDGDWRILNLERPPFRLLPPVDVLVEGCVEGGGAYADKALGLWTVADLPVAAPEEIDA
jgi:Methyltransferase domain